MTCNAPSCTPYSMFLPQHNFQWSLWRKDVKALSTRTEIYPASKPGDESHLLLFPLIVTLNPILGTNGPGTSTTWLDAACARQSMPRVPSWIGRKLALISRFRIFPTYSLSSSTVRSPTVGLFWKSSRA